MAILRGILDRIVLVVAILAAGCVPSFIAQYRQRLGGMLDQAGKDLALFQDIANRFHGGDIQRLIKDENADREQLFREIAAAKNVDLSQLQRIRETYASTLREKARSGDWIQQPDGAWVQKK